MAICVINSNAFCVEDITNIENYEKAVNSEEKYACHHKGRLCKLVDGKHIYY